MSLTKHYCTECLERKKSEHKQKRTNRRRPVLYPTILLVMSVCIQNMNFLCYKVVKIDIFDEKYGEKEKRTNTGESRLSILRHNLSLLTCIPNMNFLSLTVLEISLTKKCYGFTEERTNGRTDGRKDGQM